MAGEKNPPDLDGLIRLQSLKTGALIRAAARIGCLIGGATEEQLVAAEEYAAAIGLAFQIRDDVLDVEGDPALLGKATGVDQAHGKSTFPALVGLESCRTRIRELTDYAISKLSKFSETDFLTTLAEELALRKK
jgi:geranylgeranyl diphosphate synthase type II